MKPVAIIGGGFSGAITAVHLMRILPADHPILIFERGGPIGPGLAYSTDVAAHLLNVRAANMSVFPDDPAHFENWLRRHFAVPSADCHVTDAGLFASRRLYARYVHNCFEQAADSRPTARRPLWVRAEIADITREGDGFRLRDGAGQVYMAAALVLAMGNIPPAAADDPRHITNPWNPDNLRGLDRQAPILIVGSGLTMVDIVLSLRDKGFHGPLTALSRRGMMSSAHLPAGVWPAPVFTAGERAGLRPLLRRLRQEIEAARQTKTDWRAVIDAIRPITAELWMGWGEAERRRFLRHGRRFWDIHRHRMAPPNAAAIQRELQSGGLSLQAGRVLGMEPRGEGLAVTIRYKGGGERTGMFQRVIAATGLENAAGGRSGLVKTLCERGMTRLDPLGIGIEVGPDLKAAPGIWALGPIVRGTFWECVAVPDIRDQAVRVARAVADFIDLTPPLLPPAAGAAARGRGLDAT